MAGRSWIALLAVVLSGACGDDEAPPVATGTGSGCEGGQCGGAGGVGGAGGAPVTALCRGEPLERGDASVIDDGRGAEIACDGHVLRASAELRGVVRLRYLPDGEAPPQRPSYAIIAPPDGDLAVAVGADTTTVRVCTDELLVEIDRATCRVRVLDAGGAVVSDDPEGGGFRLGGPLGPASRGIVRAAAAGERFYGFGERTGPLDKRGRTLEFWNTDAYVDAFGGYPPDADPLYQSIPFFVGLREGRAYGVLVDDTHRLSFDMGASASDAYALWAAGGVLDEWLVAGPSLREVAARYSRLTGPAALPPRWSLGYHQSRWGYYPDDAVLAVASELRARKLPADAVWLDIQHMDGFRSFTWDPNGFDDPSALVSGLAAMGMKTVTIVDPGLEVDPAWDVYAAALAANVLLQQDGAPYVGEVWPGPASFPDFSDPAARAFWGSLVPRATDHGVRGLWIDMNEPSDFSGPGGTIPDEIAANGEGAPSTMAEMHNVYALNEARATYEGFAAAVPARRPFVLSRAGYAGIQRYAAVWTGDAPSTWTTLRTTLPMLLGLGLSGVPFVGSDVGGYSGGASSELFARWMQLGSVSPFFRAHVMTSAPPQEPWQFGTEVEDIARGAISARYELLPTIYSLFDEAIRTGAPLLRPLVFEFQQDEATHDLDDEAMLGPSLLVAPVLDEAATTRSVYLPEGRWFEVRSGAIYDGPATIDVGVTLGALPMFAREGAILARGPAVQFSDEKPLAPLTLDVYPGPVTSSFSLYEDDGDSPAHASGVFSRVAYTLESTPTGARLTAGERDGTFVPPARTLVVRVRRVDSGATAVSLDGSPLAAVADLDALVAAGEGWFWDDRDLSVVVAFADRDAFTLDLAYDATVVDPRPAVPMTFHVVVPPGTPTATPIHLASSANGWTHEPLAWGPGADEATGTFLVPRGEWVFYKYTRGDWTTVEKWPGCVEATNRYELGAAHPVKDDTVWAWADACP